MADSVGFAGEQIRSFDYAYGLQRRALRLEYGTIAWNVGEAFLTIGLGIAAASLALVGFGTDSVIEIFASVVVLWNFRATSREHYASRERTALRLVAGAFLALAVVLSIAALNDLVSGRRADASPIGIGYLAVTALVMFGLARWKRRTADSLQSAALRSEATMTMLDGVLSVLTLSGLALNAALGWWWADPTAALLVAAAALNEARENWEEASEIGQARDHG